MKLLDKTFSKILAGLIALLGFSACGNEGDMYGTPSGEYEISGMVFSEDGEKLDGAMVTTSLNDRVYSVDGHYTIKSPEHSMPFVDITVKAEKLPFESETKDVKLKYTGGDGNWYHGKADAVVDFHLKQNTIGEL